MKILIVEDSAAQRDLIREWLATDRAKTILGNFTILEAGYLQEGLALKDQVDVVILDLILPDSMPDKTIDRIHEFGKPVVILTGIGEESLIIQAMESGAKGFARKGFVGVCELAY